MLVIGLICNLLVRPVNPKHYYAGDDPTGLAHKPATPAGTTAAARI